MWVRISLALPKISAPEARSFRSTPQARVPTQSGPKICLCTLIVRYSEYEGPEILHRNPSGSSGSPVLGSILCSVMSGDYHNDDNKHKYHDENDEKRTKEARVLIP